MTPRNPGRHGVIGPWIAGLAVVLALISGCSSPNQGSPVFASPSARTAPRSAATAASDALLLTRIKTKIFSDELVSSRGIDIVVRYGVVFLEGRSGDPYQVRMLTDLIRTVDGVARVENQVKMDRTGTTFVTPDEFVSEKIKMSFLKDRDLNAYPITVDTTATQVVLSGKVGNQVQKQKASEIAVSHSGDRQVINRLTVSP